jgi:putative nucleotidyltransferase with HDIG domain
MKQIQLKNLEIGMVLAKDVIDNTGRLVFPQGSVLTENHIRRLIDYSVPGVAVQDGDSPMPVGISTLKMEMPLDLRQDQDRPWVRNLFQHANLDNPLMGKLYRECLVRLPDHVSTQYKEYSHTTPYDLVRDVTRVTVLPTVYLRLTELISNPESSSQDFAKVVNDSGLAAILLRTANSAYFGLSTKVDTLAQAITILGTRQLCELVLAFTVVKTFDSIPQKLVNMESFCHHSIACAIFSREIALMTNQKEIERFFTAGLLHDIGRLVMFSKCPEEFNKALKRSRGAEELLFNCERRIFGFDHSDVGAALLKHWNLPYSLQEAVEYHHNPRRAPSKSMEALIVHLADILTNALQYGTSGEFLVPPMQAEVLGRLGLRPDQLPAVIDDVSGQIDTVLKFILLKE